MKKSWVVYIARVGIVFDSIFSVHFVAKRYTLQQKCLRGQIGTMVGLQLIAPYIDHESHSAQRYRQTDRQTSHLCQ